MSEDSRPRTVLGSKIGLALSAGVLSLTWSHGGRRTRAQTLRVSRPSGRSLSLAAPDPFPLASGTTVTNGILPVVALVSVSFRPERYRLLAAVVLLRISLLAMFFIAERPWGMKTIDPAFGSDAGEVRRFVRKFLNHRLTEDASRAGLYILGAFVVPAIGRDPHFEKVYKGEYLHGLV